MSEHRNTFDEFDAKLEHQMQLAFGAIVAGWLIIALGSVGFSCGLLVILGKAVGLF